jgi:hypothetical protein
MYRIFDAVKPILTSEYRNNAAVTPFSRSFIDVLTLQGGYLRPRTAAPFPQRRYYVHLPHL